MIYTSISYENPWAAAINPKVMKLSRKQPQHPFHLKPIIRCHRQNPDNTTIHNPKPPKIQLKDPILVTPTTTQVVYRTAKKNRANVERKGLPKLGSQQMMILCGFGYWVQGFRCFPWLALNFHMAHNLNMHPSILQLVQHSGNLPMVAKPLYGLLSDAFYIGGAHRIPYVSIGVLLQVLSWGSLALVPVAAKALPTLMACVLLSNLGASITEVAKDALVAEYGQQHRMKGLQSYAFMALAAGGILGNLVGGYFLMKAPPRTMFLLFSVLLSAQLAISSRIREESLGLPQLSDQSLAGKPILESLRKQLSDLMMGIQEQSLVHPLTWIVASIAMVPVLSGSIFCYQTQCLNLDPSVIGMSRVIGQLMLLSTTVLYDRYWKHVPMRKLVGIVQFVYAFSLLLDFVLVRQINLRLGIPNEVFVLCFSGLAETIAQFKLLPFSVLFAHLCPRGCEGSLTAFLASALIFSSIVSGFLGVGLASLIGVTAGDYSSLPLGILVQFLAALLPLGWIHHLPASEAIVGKERKKSLSRRSQKNRRVGRVVYDSVYIYRRERESEAES
ncbi:probable folate-biopterin transporter 8, chloroplastic isoform X1 [Rosa rugosa]|uniref:probable folate-biopterin transporter 8, chloroplastic isoform X1 n=1 Tax=Rosa rugosa TaxID=74645 RepID=UPI002B408B98|nr:probable folate-biopterin transporter 8, chloroplastic isoform X1 [Rosa rugosa]